MVDFYNPGRSERKLQNDQLLIEDFVPTNKTLDGEALQYAIDQGAQNQYSEEGTSVSKEHTQLYTDEEVIIIEKAMYFSIFVVMASLLISTCLILVALYLLREHAQKVIKGSLFFIIGYFLLGGIVALVVPSVSLDNLDDEDLEMMKEADQDGKIMVAIFDFILALCFACYAKAIWSNIPFAAANLKTGVTACRANLGGEYSILICQCRPKAHIHQPKPISPFLSFLNSVYLCFFGSSFEHNNIHTATFGIRRCIKLCGSFRRRPIGH